MGTETKETKGIVATVLEWLTPGAGLKVAAKVGTGARTALDNDKLYAPGIVGKLVGESIEQNKPYAPGAGLKAAAQVGTGLKAALDHGEPYAPGIITKLAGESVVENKPYAPGAGLRAVAEQMSIPALPEGVVPHKDFVVPDNFAPSTNAPAATSTGRKK